MDKSGDTDCNGRGSGFASGKNVVVYLPTYNERENLLPIVAAIRQTLPESIILVIDDASPDGTGKMAEGLAASDSKVAVLHRAGKEGLGPAYLAGFRYAIKEFRPEIIVQMDADFSHPVESLFLMMAAVEENDLVLGTRT